MPEDAPQDCRDPAEKPVPTFSLGTDAWGLLEAHSEAPLCCNGSDPFKKEAGSGQGRQCMPVPKVHRDFPNEAQRWQVPV